VLAEFNAARVPGVIEDEHDGQLLVRLAQPWADQIGEQGESVWLSPEQLEAYVGEDIAGGATGWFSGEGVLPEKSE
jgi:hypothetical protein